MATSDKLSFPEAFEIIGESHTTDSFGSRSDYSGKFPPVLTRPRMDIVCVIDFQNHVCLSDRKKAFEEIKATSISWEPVTVHHIQVRSRFFYRIDLKICMYLSMFFYVFD